MAASLSRPDPSSPASVAEAGFSTSRRGFNQDEVRAFLTSVAAELGRLQERERQLEARLREADAEVEVTPQLDEEAVAAMLGEETLRVLQTARESASQIKVRAEDAAARILGEANDEANRLRQEAEVEAARKRHDAASDAEAEVALAKQQGREMVNEARSYRERVLADLERRTNLARQQIEDLVHGRDRLLQVFERARLVAVDVTSELQAIDGPAELVNLSPTTGPLPLMVPNSPRPTDPTDPTDTTDDVDVPTGDAVTEVADDAELDVAGAVDDEADAEAGDDAGDDAVDETAADVEDDESDDVSDEDADDASAPTPARDANVVSLFRGREPVADEPAETATDASPDPDEHDRSDVDGIFERLRSQAPADAPATATEDAVETNEDATGEDATDDDANGEDDAAEEVVESTVFSRRDEMLTPLIVSGARKLKRVLADEQNGVLDRLRQKESVTSLDDIVPDADEHGASYVDALADELLDAAAAGAGEAGKNDTATLRTTLRKAALGPAHDVVRDDLVHPLRSRLERAVSDGAGDNEDITRRIRSVYREWKTQHIDDQLDDAFRFAYGGGMSAGVKPGTPLRWMIDPSEPSCPDCEDNSLGGEVPAGEAFPTGHTMAPAHPGCRCLAAPAGQ